MGVLSGGKSNYGFVDAGPSAQTFAVTGDYADIARNHCAATMLTNVMLQHDGAGAAGPPWRSLFCGVHAAIGNGPVLWIPRRANRYLAANRVPVVCRQVNRHLCETRPDRLAAILYEEIAAGRVCGLMVAASALQWHWVLAVSAERNADGTRSFLIADGWHARRMYRYVPDQGSRLMAIATFRREK